MNVINGFRQKNNLFDIVWQSAPKVHVFYVLESSFTSEKAWCAG